MEAAGELLCLLHVGNNSCTCPSHFVGNADGQELQGYSTVYKSLPEAPVAPWREPGWRDTLDKTVMWMVAKRGAVIATYHSKMQGRIYQELSCHTSATAFSLRLAFLQLFFIYHRRRTLVLPYSDLPLNRVLDTANRRGEQSMESVPSDNSPANPHASAAGQ